jgi:Caspase domain
VNICRQCESLLTPSIRQPPSLFALIIGIDKYKNDFVKPLKGPITDAKEMKDYLEKKLGVPPSHIKTLFDEDATRNGIIQGIRALKDTNVKEGDPILIYFAGHCVTGVPPDGKIAVLVPYDIDYTADKHVVNAIPDSAMGILLEDLAKAKGDNIVRLGQYYCLRRCSSI